MLHAPADRPARRRRPARLLAVPVAALLAASALATSASSASASAPPVTAPEALPPVPASAAPAGTPLSELLRPDGTLDTSTGFSGSLDPQGYRLSTAPDGSPRFTPSGDAAASATATASPTGSLAGDAAWADPFAMPGTGYGPYAVAVSGSDVYVGGYFTTVGGLPAGSANHIARWDGHAWSPLGKGVDGTVTAIAVVGGAVYAGGDFVTASGKVVNHVARWNGSGWSAMGSGLAYPGGTASVHALLGVGGALWVGGQFATAGGTTVNSLATWSGGAWHAVGSGVLTCLGCGTPYPGTVEALASDGTTVWLGGSFDQAGSATTSSLAAVTGGAYSSVGGGVTTTYGGRGTVHALAVDGGALYVGGEFGHAGTTPANSMARWSGGVWDPLGGGMTRYGSAGTVSALTVSGGSVYAGGSFDTAGTTAVSYLARWTGTAWKAVGGGVDGAVSAMASSGSTAPYLVGDFSTIGVAGGRVSVNYAARVAGGALAALGQGLTSGSCCGYVNAVAATDKGKAYAGGYFTQAGSSAANGVAQWTGSAWKPMGTGVTGQYGTGTVNAVAVVGGDVYVGGSFTTAGGKSASNVARWDGTRWYPMASGTNGPVYALTVMGGLLYVGGDFSAAGPTGAVDLARWDPVAAKWAKVGRGAHPDGGSVRALAPVGDRYLVVGGDISSFTDGTADATVNGLAYWDSQATQSGSYAGWYTPGHGVFHKSTYGDYAGEVYALAVDGTTVYVGGDFDKAGDGVGTTNAVSVPSLVRIDLGTNRWSALGGGIGGGDVTVAGLLLRGGLVYVAGDFVTAGSATSPGVAAWSTTGAGWTGLGKGLGGDSAYTREGRGLAVGGTSLWVVGDFSTAGGRASHNVARWALR